MSTKTSKSIATNTTMLMLMNLATMIFPLLTLPYLTRVLSNEAYGTIVYIKAVMSYMQILVDFGFILSATKDIVRAQENQDSINQITSDTLMAKLILCGVAFIILCVMMFTLPILRQAKLITILYFIVVVLSIFLFDYLFRGIEQMHVITIRYVLMKGIAVLLTFVFVKSDADLIKLPVLDIAGSLIAVVLVAFSLKKYNVRIVKSQLHSSIKKIKESAVYFASNAASLSFSALSTIVLGAVLTASDVAYWGIATQIVSAIQSFYTPITNGIYPAMVQRKEFRLIKKFLLLFMPIIAVGCIFTYYAAPFAIKIVAGEGYTGAVPVLRGLIPVLFFGFPAILFGWPALGAIGKEKQNTAATVISVLFQMAGIGIMIIFGKFTLMSATILRSLTEILMFTLRAGMCYKFRFSFAKTRHI